MKVVKALILSGHGINCEEETASAFNLAGAKADIVHLNKFFNNELNLDNYDILTFPGGFSFGDDLGAGIVLATKLKKHLPEIKDFIKNNGYIIGICNGFQLLINLGLIPDTALVENTSKKFIDNWVNLKVNKNSNSPFFSGIDEIYLPIRHQEGRLIIGDENIKNNILKNNLNILTYKNNPNGSDLDIAALIDPTGQVLGMMPHPEAFLSLYNNPNWPKLKKDNPNISEDGEGLKIFKNIVEHIGRS